MVTRQVITDISLLCLDDIHFKSSSKYGKYTYKKLRLGDKSKLCFKSNLFKINEVLKKSKKDDIVRLLIDPEDSFESFLLSLEEKCGDFVANNKSDLLPNMDDEDYMIENIKYVNGKKKVILYSKNPLEEDVFSQETLICLEGIYFNNGKFGILWSVDVDKENIMKQYDILVNEVNNKVNEVKEIIKNNETLLSNLENITTLLQNFDGSSEELEDMRSSFISYV